MEDSLRGDEKAGACGRFREALAGAPEAFEGAGGLEGGAFEGPPLPGRQGPDGEALRAHLAGCQECRQAAAEHRAVWSLLERVPDPPRTAGPEVLGPEEFLRAVRARIARNVASRRFRAGALAAAAALVVSSLLWLLPGQEDGAVIEDLAVLQDFISQEASTPVEEVGRELLALLEDPSGPVGETGELEDWFDLLYEALDEGGKRG